MKQCEDQTSLFSAEASRDHANRFPLPGSEEARTMTVISGRKCAESLTSSGPLGLLVKTLLESSVWRSTLFYLNWKVSATPARRLLYRLVPSKPRTEETGALLWPTPAANDSKNSTLPMSQISRGTVPGAVIRRQIWPTPTASDYRKRGPNSRQQGLPETVLKESRIQWPTPTTGKIGGGSGSRESLKKLSLEGKITEAEYKSMVAGNGGSLNPVWVEWLMGFPLDWTSKD